MNKRRLITIIIIACSWVSVSYVLCKFPFKITYREVAFLAGLENDNLISMYDNLLRDNYELPNLFQFAVDVLDSTKARKLYSTLSNDGYELTDFRTFYNDIAITDDLKEIIDNMIRAGEPDSNIDIVVRNYTPFVLIEQFNQDLFIILNIIGLSFLVILLISFSKNKKQILGFIILIVAWELLAYSVSKYFFRIDSFNEDLFTALNIVGLALLLILFGYKLIKGTEKTPHNN